VRKIVFANYRTYKPPFPCRAAKWTAIGKNASALLPLRAKFPHHAKTRHFRRPAQKQADFRGVSDPQSQYLPKYCIFAKIWIPPKGNFSSTDGF
jgi:hypothetical protein